MNAGRLPQDEPDDKISFYTPLWGQREAVGLEPVDVGLFIEA
jgi:hypothetical protein